MLQLPTFDVPITTNLIKKAQIINTIETKSLTRSQASHFAHSHNGKTHGFLRFKDRPPIINLLETQFCFL
jgi:hypothetical protein